MSIADNLLSRPLLIVSDSRNFHTFSINHSAGKTSPRSIISHEQLNLCSLPTYKKNISRSLDKKINSKLITIIQDYEESQKLTGLRRFCFKISEYFYKIFSKDQALSAFQARHSLLSQDKPTVDGLTKKELLREIINHPLPQTGERIPRADLDLMGFTER